MSSWWSALNPFVEVRAEESHEEEDEKDSKEGEAGEEEEKDEDEGGDDNKGDDDEEEEEEEEEEEPEDIKPKLVERAMNRSCPAEKHHFDACAARVAKAAENPEKEHHGHPEDCAEEFLHLMHCVDKTIAEPLFKQLK